MPPCIQSTCLWTKQDTRMANLESQKTSITITLDKAEQHLQKLLSHCWLKRWPALPSSLQPIPWSFMSSHSGNSQCWNRRRMLLFQMVIYGLNSKDNRQRSAFHYMQDALIVLLAVILPPSRFSKPSTPITACDYPLLGDLWRGVWIP